MMKHLIPVIIVGGLFLGGCGSSDSGDTTLGDKSLKEGPKSIDQLPPDMPPEARQQAAAAMAQGQAMNARMEAEAQAMKKARERAGN